MPELTVFVLLEKTDESLPDIGQIRLNIVTWSGIVAL